MYIESVLKHKACEYHKKSISAKGFRMSVFFVCSSFEAIESVSVESYLLDGEERSLALRVAEQGSEVVRQRISSFACLRRQRKGNVII